MSISNEFTRVDIEFSVEGTILRGWLFKPISLVNMPAVVMAHGWGCLKEFYLDRYAEAFAKRGLAVLVFDNRNFGASDGEIRQEIDPWQQVRDYRHAITFIQSLPFVDASQIGIWGTSYSGGHVLTVAAIDKRVKAVVSQVPTISGWQGMLRRIFPANWEKTYADFNEDRAERFKGAPPRLVPIYSNPSSGTNSSHASQDAYEFYSGRSADEKDKWRFQHFRNEVTLRSVEMYSEYEPGAYIERIAPTPLLMLVAENDVVAVTDQALQAFNRANGVKSLHVFKGGHFSAYNAESNTLANMAAEWFEKYLKMN